MPQEMRLGEKTFFPLTCCYRRTRVSKSDVSAQIPDLLTMTPYAILGEMPKSQTTANSGVCAKVSAGEHEFGIYQWPEVTCEFNIVHYLSCRPLPSLKSEGCRAGALVWFTSQAVCHT